MPELSGGSSLCAHFAQCSCGLWLPILGKRFLDMPLEILPDLKVLRLSCLLHIVNMFADHL